MRIISQAGIDALDRGRIAKRTLLRGDFSDGVFAVWDDVGSLDYAGETYLGAAGRFEVSQLPSTDGLTAASLEVRFNGLDTVVVNDLETAGYHQRAVTVTLAVFDIDTRALIFARPWFAGFVDTLVREERGGGLATVTVRCETMARELGRRGGRTRSDADQQGLTTGDLFFEHVAAAVSQQIYWGRSGPQRVRET